MAAAGAAALALLSTPVLAAGPASKPPAAVTRRRRIAGFWKGSQLIGAKVEDASGKSIGKIEDVMLDTSGKVEYAVRSFGGFLGIGDKWYTIPWNALTIEADRSASDIKQVILDVNTGDA